MFLLMFFAALLLAAVVLVPYIMPTDPSPLVRTALGFFNGTPKDVQLAPLDGPSGARPTGHWLQVDAARAYNAMRAEAEATGVLFTLNTSFRDNDFQRRLFAMYLAGTGNLAARPGFSTHQQGRSVDISTHGQGRASKEYQWLTANAARFNFTNDVASEPWHWTYVGPITVQDVVTHRLEGGEKSHE